MRAPLTAIFLEGNYIMNDQKGELPSLAWICSETWQKSAQSLSDAAQMWVPASGGRVYLLTSYSLYSASLSGLLREVLLGFSR